MRDFCYGCRELKGVVTFPMKGPAGPHAAGEGWKWIVGCIGAVEAEFACWLCWSKVGQVITWW